MSISVVTPAYNVEDYLGASIEGVLAQTVSDWELVIVDDGSMDRTAEVAERYAQRDSRISLLRQANSFIAAARNRGFRATSRRSDFVIFLDADDLWERDALAVLLTALDASPSAVAAYGLPRAIDARGEPCEPGEMEVMGRHRRGVVGTRLVPWPISAPTTLAVLAFQNCIYTPGQMLIRRRALEAVGLFDEKASPAEDWDLSLRLSVRGPLAYVDRVVLNWRSHEGSTTRRHRELVAPKHHYVRCKLQTSAELTHEQRRIARRAHLIWSSQFCSQTIREARLRFIRGHFREAVGWLRLAARQYAELRRSAVVG